MGYKGKERAEGEKKVNRGKMENKGEKRGRNRGRKGRRKGKRGEGKERIKMEERRD